MSKRLQRARKSSKLVGKLYRVPRPWKIAYTIVGDGTVKVVGHTRAGIEDPGTISLGQIRYRSISSLVRMSREEIDEIVKWIPKSEWFNPREYWPNEQA